MKTINRDQLITLNEKQKSDFILINVLPRDKFNAAHIRTSINIPLENDNFSSLVESVAGSKRRKIVVYCASFECDASPQAANKLEEAGFEDVLDYEGGTKDWIDHRHVA